MRTPVLALLAVAGLGLSACGGGNSSHDVVPSSLPDLTVPQGSAALAKPANSTTDTTGGTTSTPSGTTSTSPSSGATGTTTQGSTTPAAPSGTAQGGAGGTGSGGTAPGGTSSGTGNGNTGGASPGEFNQFCQDNPGACPGN